MFGELFDAILNGKPMNDTDMLDLDTVTEVTTADIAIKHPVTGAPTGAVITVAGPEHPKRRKILFDRQRAQRAKFAKAGKLQFDDPEDDDAAAIALLAACTFGWSRIGRNGQPLQFSEQAAATLYADPKFGWLRAQVQAGMDARENFIQNSGTPSSSAPASSTD